MSSVPVFPLVRRTNAELLPERRFEGDLFDREQLAQRLTGLLSRMPEGAVLAIDSPWGDGKTWFGRRWHASLRDDGFRTAFVDCFQRDHIDDPFVVIAGELLELAKRDNDSSRNKLLAAGVKLGASLIPAATKMAVNAAGHLILGNSGLSDDIVKSLESLDSAAASGLEKLVAKRLEDYQTDKKGIEGFRSALKDMAAESAKPVVIFLDELDRCRPDFAVRMIERIKHFFDVPGVVFVLLINRRQLVAAIKGMYGSNLDAEAYLAKFVQLMLTLPKSNSLDRSAPNDNISYCKQVLKRYQFPVSANHVSDFALAMGTLATLFNLSLRDIERSVVLYSFAQPVQSGSAHLAWPIALKLAKPDLFKALQANGRRAHADTMDVIANLGGAGSAASHVLSLFGKLHQLASDAAETTPPADVLGAMHEVSNLGSPKAFMQWFFQRVDLELPQ